MWERSAPCIDISVGADVYETFMYVFTWPMVWPEILCHKARFVRFTRPTTSYGRGNISPSSHADFRCCRSVSSSLPQLSTLELSEIWFLSDKLKCGIVMDQNLHIDGFGKIDRNSSNLLLLLLMYTLYFLNTNPYESISDSSYILLQLINKSAVWIDLKAFALVFYMLYPWFCIISYRYCIL